MTEKEPSRRYKLKEVCIRLAEGHPLCTTQDVTGWNSRENARKWRKDLADTINAVNDKNGLRENFWEHRSFAEQGLDTIPQIHLGEKASALERAGIQTERDRKSVV